MRTMQIELPEAIEEQLYFNEPESRKNYIGPSLILQSAARLLKLVHSLFLTVSIISMLLR